MQDWFTFINHLYPQNASSPRAPRSAREGAALPEKRSSHGSSMSISRNPLPTSARSLSHSSSTSVQVQEMSERNRVIDAVIRKFNEGFFLPRGLQIERERSRSLSTAGNGSSVGSREIADRVARGIEIFYSQRFTRSPSSSKPSQSPRSLPPPPAESLVGCT